MGQDSEILAELWAQFAKQAHGITQTLDLPWPKLSNFSRALGEGRVLVLGGPQNTGKSFFVTHIAMKVHEQGGTWRYLPLEDDKQDFALRLLSIRGDTYRYLDEDKDGGLQRLRGLEEHEQWMREMLACVDENPRKPTLDDAGEMQVRNFTSDDCLEWIRESMQEHRVLFVDPVTQIDFMGKNQWQDENRFIREFLALAAHYKGTIVFVTHTKDRSGLKGQMPITVEDLQGSTFWRKLCHCVVLLDAHEEKASTIYRRGDDGELEQEVLTHNRTVVIGRTRYGKGSRMVFAYDQDNRKPIFREHGLVVPKARREKNDG